jgi:lipopolysaccharide transport system ATP-binding protein
VQIESCTWEDCQRTVTVKPFSGKEALIDTPAQSPIVVSSGESVCIKIGLLSEIAFEASVGILLRDRFGQDIFGVNTAMLKLPVSLVSGQTGSVDFRISIDLAPGAYTLTTAVHTDTTHIHDCQHWWDNALEFEVVGFKKAPFSGIVGLDCQATFTKTP